MTGDANLDMALIVLAVVLGAVGNAFGWPWLVRLAEWIKARDSQTDTKNGTPDPTPDPIPVALRGNAQEVAGGSLLTILLPFLTTLIPLILDLIAKFRERNGREPTRREVNEMIRKAQQATQEGRVHAVMLDDGLAEQDLERVTAGASKVNGIVSHAHQTMRHANESMVRIDAAVAEVQGLLRR